MHLNSGSMLSSKSSSEDVCEAMMMPYLSTLLLFLSLSSTVLLHFLIVLNVVTSTVTYCMLEGFTRRLLRENSELLELSNLSRMLTVKK